MTYVEHSKNIGKTFNRMTIVGICKKYVGGMDRVHYNCKCSCGNFKTVIANHIIIGHVLSCGCFHREISAITCVRVRTTHGMKNTVEYKTYMQAKSRCNNPNASKYNYYGGRGIKFLFTSFEEFFTEVGIKPHKDYQLDRIDNDGNYERGNVRWVTPSENCLNRRSSLNKKL